MVLGNVLHSAMRPVRCRAGETCRRDEPQQVAEAAYRLKLKHVVITTGDPPRRLARRGAEHYQCVIAVRQDGAVVEVTPDFLDDTAAIDRAGRHAEVFNHNLETVAALYRKLLATALNIAAASACSIASNAVPPRSSPKSGLMLGI